MQNYLKLQSKKSIRISETGFTHYLVPAIVIVLVATIGVKLIVSSHADPISDYTGFYTAAQASDGENTNQGANGVFETQDTVNGIGTQLVSDVTPGSQLSYDLFPGKSATTKTCYYLRVYNSPKAEKQVMSAKIQFVGDGSSSTVNVLADDNYHAVCVATAAAGSTATQLPYNVDNMSPSAFVLVYQAIVYYD
jgi:hypothetical protein